MFWLCRNQASDIEMPDKFQSLFMEADLIKGHMYSKTSHSHISEDQIQQRITEGDVLTLEGRRCVQWAFMKTSVVKELAILIKGKLYVETHSPILG